MGRMRKTCTENFKRKVAIEAIREKKTRIMYCAAWACDAHRGLCKSLLAGHLR